MLKVTKKHEPVSSAKAIVAILVLAIAAVIFYKFVVNQDNFFGDPEALRNYVLFSIAVGGFLIGLLYLTSQTKHKEVSKSKSPSKSKKKK